MNKIKKIVFTLFVSIILMCILTLNNKAYAKNIVIKSPFSTTYSTVTSDIKNSNSYTSLNLGYRIDYNYTATNTKTLLPKTTGFFNYEFDENISSKYFSNSDNEVTMKIVQNDGAAGVLEALLGVGLPIKLNMQGNCNGNELVINTANNIAITSFSFTCGSYINEIQYSTNAKGYNTHPSDTQYTYNLSDECTEIRIKNISNTYNIDIDNINIDVTTYTKTATYSIKKDNDNKNICSMQMVGRISKLLYQQIGSVFDPSLVTFGMFYGNYGSLDSGDISIVKNKIANGIEFRDNNIKGITEINYSSLNGYDETGFTIDNDNPTYYQWGVSINHISSKKLYPVIIAVPYVKFKNSENTYDVYLLKSTINSVMSLCKEYYDLNVGTDMDKEVLHYYGYEFDPWSD